MENKFRKSKFYKGLTNYNAIAIAEGFCEDENVTKHQRLCAWQYLIDTNLCWHLQGWFGRTATSLIEQKICDRKRRKTSETIFETQEERVARKA